MSDKLKGVWVEGRLWENKELLLVEKHLLQKIHDLDNENGCTAMNAWFAEFLGISKSRVSQLISKFKKDKLVSVKLKFEGKQVVGRVINVLKGGVLLIKGGVLSVNRPLSYAKHPPLAGSEESNIILLNNTISNLRESKKALTQEIELLQIMNKKYKEEIEALNSELKKEVVPPPTDYSPRKPRRKKELPKGFESELDKSLKSYTFPKEIQTELLEKTLEYFSYMEQKKGSNWGIARTVNAQVKTIKDLTAKFTDEEIISSLDECMDNGNVSFNPQWTLNRSNSKTEKQKGPKKFSYELPEFVSKNQREAYFRARLATYRPQLDNRTYNTVYHKRAYGPQRDVEGVVHDLEQEKPELLKIKFIADSWQDIQ